MQPSYTLVEGEDATVCVAIDGTISAGDFTVTLQTEDETAEGSEMAGSMKIFVNFKYIL